MHLTFTSLHSIDNQFKRISILILFIVWLQSASILSKSFTGLLLNTYFNVKSVPIINELQDIIDNKHMMVAMDRTTLINFGNQYKKSVNKLNLNEISKRTKLFNQKYNITFKYVRDSPVVHELIIKGKVVIICHTTHRKEFFQKYPHLKDKVSVAPVKYLGEKLSYAISNKNLIAKEILYL